MKRGVIFWAVALIVIGILLLLGALDVIPIGWGLVWPLLLIAAGAWLVRAALTRPVSFEVQETSIPLDNAARAHVSIHHGAGRLIISPGAPSGRLVEGSFGGGLDYRADRAGDLLDVRMRIPDQGRRWANPWSWQGAGLDWVLALNPEVALDLELETGAGALEADMSGLKVERLHLKTGASSSELVLPANAGFTRVELEGGATSVSIRVPPGVAARIISRGGASSTKVDLNRFPPTSDGYRSADYETAPNKVDILANLGAASLSVR
jgi:LiaI-LiaF-like transmembrane region